MTFARVDERYPAMGIRDEASTDRAEVERLNRLAFGGDAEAQLIARLRDGR